MKKRMFRKIAPKMVMLLLPLLLCGGTEVGFDKMPPPLGADFSPFLMTVPLCQPLEAGQLTDPFGWRFHPLSGQLDFHGGADLAADKGTPIRAAAAGTVMKADEEESYGKYLVLDHQNGFSTLYAHCSRLLVREGQAVKKGQVIARVGATGEATGPHLHFEIRQNGCRLDPLWALGDGERLKGEKP